MVKATQAQLWLNEFSNDVVGQQLDEMADRLAQQGTNRFRVLAYRHAAVAVRELVRPVRDILDDEGLPGLLKVRGIGPTIGQAIQQFAQTGKLPRLDQLREAGAPQRIFTTVAEIGPKLAAEIHDQLGIATLADLEAAAWDGRLARVPGMGRKRIQAVREALAGRLRLMPGQKPKPRSSRLTGQPSVSELLDIDDEYRRLAVLDRLPRIAPRRFNPEGKAWLPILRTEREGRRYTALYSNTARAHELGTIRDWVVIHREAAPDEGAPDGGQWTVITSRLGNLVGRRIVRGRERECAEHYAALAARRSLLS